MPRSGARCDKDKDPAPSLASRTLDLSRYPSLQAAALSRSSHTNSGDGSLEESSPHNIPPPALVGILFAAGWCDDCQAFVPLLQELCRYHRQVMMVEADQTLQRPSSPSSPASPLSAILPDLAVVYVSSDRSTEEMMAFKPPEFLQVPFERVEERCRLKLELGACARKEIDDEDNRLRLSNEEPVMTPQHRVEIVPGMTPSKRRHGIPTLVWVEAGTGLIVTDMAAEHISGRATAAQQKLNTPTEGEGAKEEKEVEGKVAWERSVLELWGNLLRASIGDTE